MKRFFIAFFIFFSPLCFASDVNVTPSKEEIIAAAKVLAGKKWKIFLKKNEEFKDDACAYYKAGCRSPEFTPRQKKAAKVLYLFLCFSR